MKKSMRFLTAVLPVMLMLSGCGLQDKNENIKAGMTAIEALDYDGALESFAAAREAGEDERLLVRGEGIAYMGKTEYEAAINSCYFVLTDDRKKLYERIESRVDQMLSKGLVDEVRTLKERGCNASMVSMQGLGYKEILEYLDGRCSLLEAVEKIKKETRHFAKRQLTWFRREKDVIWLDKQAFAYDEDAVLSCILENLRKKEIIK